MSANFLLTNWTGHRYKFTTRVHLREYIALGFVLAVYVITFSLMPKNVFWSPDEGIRFMMSEILNPGFDDQDSSGYPGSGKDPAYRFHPSYYRYAGILYPVPNSDGTVKHPWATVFPLLSGWLFDNFGITGIYLIPMISGWLTTLVVWRLSRKLIPSMAFWVILLVGLGTPLYFYSQVFWDHTLATLLGIAALSVVVMHPKPTIKLTVLVVLLLLIAAALRVEMLVFALCLGLAWRMSKRRAHRAGDAPVELGNGDGPPDQDSSWTCLNPKTKLLAEIGFVVFVTLLSLVLILAFVLPVRYQSEINQMIVNLKNIDNFLAASGGFLVRNIGQLPHLLINSPAAEGLLLSEGLIWAGILAILLCLGAVLVRSRILQSSMLILSMVLMCALSLAAVLAAQSYRSLHGIFISAPYGVIVIFALPQAWQRRKYPELVIFLCAALYLVVGITTVLLFRAGRENGTWPGLEWGQRYLLTLYPILAVLSLLVLKDYLKSLRPSFSKNIVMGVLIFMMVISVQIQLRGVWMLHQSKQTISGWLAFLPDQASEPVVTDVWWLPATLATYFTTHEMYSINDAEDFTEWVARVGVKGLESFTYVSDQPINLEEFNGPGLFIQLKSRQTVAGLHFIRYALVWNGSG
jgi:hypothetical protein